MSNALEKLTGHYKQLVAGGPMKIEVEELDLTIHFYPPTPHMTGELDAAQEGKDVGLQMALKIVHLALDEKGEPLFSRADATELYRHTSMAILTDICRQMAVAVSMGDVEKN